MEDSEIDRIVEEAIRAKKSKVEILLGFEDSGVNRNVLKDKIVKTLNALEYREWVSYVLKNPFSTDPQALWLVLVSIISAIVFGIVGFSFFPAGDYPRIVAAAPGLVAGLVVFFSTSRLFYSLRT